MPNISKFRVRISAEHTDHCPDSVLLADVVRTSTERLLTANREAASVHQVTEELPTYVLFSNLSQTSQARNLTSRDLEVLETFLLGNKIDGCTGWHTPGQTLDATLLEVRNRLGPVRNDGNRVTGGDERALSVDHVTITVTIGSGTEGNVVLLDSLDQGVSICQVRVGMSSTEVGGWDTILGGRLGETKLVDEDGAGVGTGNTVQAVKKDVETLRVGEEVLDQLKVEDRFEDFDVISDGINYLNLQRTISGFSDLREVDLETEVQPRYGQGYASG